MVDFVDFDEEGVDDVVAHDFEIGVFEEVNDIGFGASEKIVHGDDVVAIV